MNQEINYYKYPNRKLQITIANAKIRNFDVNMRLIITMK